MKFARTLFASALALLCAALLASSAQSAEVKASKPKKAASGASAADAAAKVVVPEGVRYVPNIAYLPADRTEKIDLYLPEKPEPGMRRPAVLMIHGGGWMGGDKAARREQNIGANLVQAGFVAASVNYRLGEGAWPTNIHDCKNAVRFLRAKAAEYGIDPDRIGVLGGSAGGHLALMVGLTAHVGLFEPDAPYPGVSSRVSAIINLYGITNLNTRRKTDAQGNPVGEPYYGGAARAFSQTGAGDPEFWKSVSPVTYVRPDSPPVLSGHGLVDTTVDYLQAKELAQVLDKAGVANELVLLEGVGHTFDFDNWGKKPITPDFKRQALAFLKKYVAKTEGR